MTSRRRPPPGAPQQGFRPAPLLAHLACMMSNADATPPGSRPTPRPLPWPPVRFVSAFAVALGLAACGSDAPPESRSSGPLPPGPPGTDIWLATLTSTPEGMPSIGRPENVTERPGYDNQPYFLPDGSGFWFTAVDDHSGQADIWRYDIASAGVAQVTQSAPESEYSATPLPDGSGISVIRVEADSTQRLWRFDADGRNAAVLIPDVAGVGYHKWADDRTVVMFVLGDPATLQIWNENLGLLPVAAHNVGRSIQPIPGSRDVSYVQRHEDGTSSIMRLRPGTGESELLIATLDGGDFHAWTPDGVLLMGHRSSLVAWKPGSGSEWTEVANFADIGMTISRLAVSPDGAHIAIVAEF